MKIALDLSDETVWALLELSGEASLEEALTTALAGYIRSERQAKLRALGETLELAEEPG